MSMKMSASHFSTKNRKTFMVHDNNIKVNVRPKTNDLRNKV